MAYTAKVCDIELELEVLKRVMLDSHSDIDPAQLAGKFQHDYVGNPAAPGICVALRSETDDIVGVQFMSPRRFSFGDRDLTCAVMADYAVDAGHRILGPALILLKSVMREGTQRFSLIFGVPNKASGPVAARAGLKRIAPIMRLVRPLRARVLWRTRPDNQWLQGWEPLLDLLMLAGEFVLRRARGQRLNVREAAYTDAQLSGLWAQRNRALFLADRSPQSIEWRFRRMGVDTRRLALVTRPDGTPFGYLIWHLRDQVAVVSDFFTADPDHETGALMLAVVRYLRQAGADLISVDFAGRDEIPEALRSVGFMLRPCDDVVIGKFSETCPGVDVSCLYLTEFDRDI